MRGVVREAIAAESVSNERIDELEQRMVAGFAGVQEAIDTRLGDVESAASGHVRARELTGLPAPRPPAGVVRVDEVLAEVMERLEGGETVGVVGAVRRPATEAVVTDDVVAETSEQQEGGEAAKVVVRGGGVVGVLGIGGVGKTTAATVVAAEAGTMGFAGVVWLTAGVEQPSVAERMRLLRWFAFKGLGVEMAVLEVAGTIKELQQLIEERLEAIAGRLLVVVDDVWTKGQAADFSGCVKAPHGLLFTTRRADALPSKAAAVRLRRTRRRCCGRTWAWMRTK